MKRPCHELIPRILLNVRTRARLPFYAWTKFHPRDGLLLLVKADRTKDSLVPQHLRSTYKREANIKFLLQHFLPNAIDVFRSGRIPNTKSLITAEMRWDHRVRRRLAVAEIIPKGGIGAELGVFTGLFSVALLRTAQPKEMTFVDPWMLEFGVHYPDWGFYTDHGRLSTEDAKSIAVSRIMKNS